MNERLKILTLLEEGKITPEQADLLLDALEQKSNRPKSTAGAQKNILDFRALGAQMTATVTQTLGEVKRSLEQFDGWPFGSSVSATVERKIPESIQRLSMETMNGKLQAQTWDEPYIRVYIRGDVRAEALPDAKRLLEEAVQMTQTEDHMHISIAQKSSREGVVGASIDVYLPKGLAQLSLQSKNGSVQADSLVVDKLHLHTTNGGVWVYKVIASDMRLTSTNGGIEVLKSVPNTCKHVYASTKHGNIVIEDIDAPQVVGRAKTAMGRIDLQPNDNIRVTFDDTKRRTQATFSPIDVTSEAETRIHCETNMGGIRIRM